MKPEIVSGSLLGVMSTLLLSSAGMGCSTSGLAVNKDAAASGGGGAPGVGGMTSLVGTGGSGTTGLGGATGTGGQPGTGGMASGGATSIGHTQATGGAARAGGAFAAGGTLSTGGVISKGGIPGTGGVPGNGGGQGKEGGSPGAGGTGTGGSIGTGGGTCVPPTVELTGTNAVANGPLITFNDEGGWFAYQDERAVVDVKGGKLVVGSVALGGERSGDIEAVIYDLATGKVGAPAKLGNLGIDDHNAPALIVRPDGKYVAAWAANRSDCSSYFSIYDGSAWSAPIAYDWTPKGCPWFGGNSMVTYANLWYMDGRLLDLTRSVETSPNALASSDDGATWSYVGRLMSTLSSDLTDGYYKYWGNNTDRIDFLGTQAHPRDADNSLWHGYLQGGKLYDSTGTVVDDGFASPAAKTIDKFTKVFATHSVVGEVELERAWNYDIVRYDDGTIAILGQGRVRGTGTDDPDKRSFYGRFDGTRWTLTYLVKMGPKLSSSQQDYTGMGTLHPDDPTTIFISTPYDPRDDTRSGKHEIWRGTTCDHGATFQWAPVTANSSKSNIRPIVPKWGTQHTALLWMQGSFQSDSYVTSSVVGIVTGP